MVFLVRLIAVFIMVVGCIFLVSPKTAKEVMGFWEKGKRLYGAAVIRMFFGVIFLVASTQCRLTMIVIILGVIMLASGMIIFTIPMQKLKGMIKTWQKKPDAFLRLVSLLPLGLGLFILYSV